MSIADKNNKVLLNSSMKVTCFGLKDHQAIKYMELFRNLQDITNFYKVFYSNRLALKICNTFIYTVVC